MDVLIEIIKAIILGIIEGLTEWLPVSSTGHMIIVDEFIRLNVSPGFMSLFLTVIQLGAIMAVITLYFERLNPWAKRKSIVQKRSTWQIWALVLIGCLPAAVIGVLLDDWVEEHFYNALIVSITLIVYGVAFISVERMRSDKPKSRHLREPNTSVYEGVLSIQWTTALKIGLFQCLAIIPGTSRSGATILGARILGVPRAVAAEFSFFLAIPVMFGWSALKALKVLLIDRLTVTASEWLILAVGVVTAFSVSIVVIRFLVGFVQRNSFAVFGWYRIILGITLLIFFGITGSLL